MKFMKFRSVIIILAATVALASCNSPRQTLRGSRASRITPVHSVVNPGSMPRGSQPANERTSHLFDVARSWIGTPYVFGGNDRKGVDCSGFTCAVFDSALGIKLPRSSREQAEFCKPVYLRDLKPGDLVFFSARAGGDRINHVAIYMGDNAIIHATTSLGVVITDLNENYWRTHFKCAGRVPGANL